MLQVNSFGLTIPYYSIVGAIEKKVAHILQQEILILNTYAMQMELGYSIPKAAPKAAFLLFPSL